MMIALIITTMISTKTYAYFDRGPVGISMGRSSVSVPANGTVNVTISLSPATDNQLPGCGMAECPQLCGEKSCLDANGQCMCAGTTYKSYTTSVTVTSSNSSVATGSYSNGILTVQGVSEGEADLTLTASLRQFTNGTAGIKVKVTKAEVSTQKPQETTTKPADSSSGVIVKNVTSSTGNTSGETSSSCEIASEGESQSSSTDETEKTVNSDRGLIIFTPIKDGKMGKTQLEEIKGKQEYVNFQKSDASGNLLYVWEFLGKDLKDAFDFNMGIDIGNTPFKGTDLKPEGEAVYLSFSHDGDLPGKASVYLRVSDWLKDGDTVNLYYYNEETGRPELVQKALTVKDNYITIEIEHCSDYILGNLDIAQTGSSHTVIIVVVIIAVLVIGGVCTLIFLKKRKTKIE